MGRLFVFCGAPVTGSINILLLGSGIVRVTGAALCASIDPETGMIASNVGREARRIHGENITAIPKYQIVSQVSSIQGQYSTFLSRQTSAKSEPARHSALQKHMWRGQLQKSYTWPSSPL